MKTELDYSNNKQHRPKKLEFLKRYVSLSISLFTMIQRRCNCLVYNTQYDDRVKSKVISPYIAILSPFQFSLDFPWIESF